MRARLEHSRLCLDAETQGEADLLARAAAELGGRPLTIEAAAMGLELLVQDGRAPERTGPVNVWSGAADPAIRSIGNLAAAPFHLDGVRYASVESFWQGLKLPEAERARIAALDGHAAHAAAKAHPYGSTVTYRGEAIPVGAFRHWRLMARANWAKFTQNEPNRRALLATLPRPLEHRTRPDSKAIPGVIMADIWMRIRAVLAEAGDGPYPDELPED